MFSPRKHQVAARNAYLAHDHSTGGAMLVMATGTGKTATAHYIMADYLRRGERVLWLAHQNRLVKQPLTADGALRKYFPEFLPIAGIVQGQEYQAHRAQLVYASMQTLGREKRLAQLLAHGAFGLVVVDEAHHSVSPQYKKVLDAFGGAHFLGLTATPDREDSRRLSDRWSVVYAYTILDALSDGVLLPPYVAVDRVPDLDLSKVGGRKDYTAPDLERALIRAHIVEHTVAAVKKMHVAQRLPFLDHNACLSCDPGAGGGIVFTATVDQAKRTAEALCADGWRAAYIAGEWITEDLDADGAAIRVPFPEKLRDSLFEQFERGEIDILCNAQLITEGVDIPRAQWCVLARPTKSWSLYVQMVGRVLRPHGTQEKALVLDLVGATKIHSIIAAPVLVDGDDCPGAEDGQHKFVAIAGTGEGRCLDCGKVIRCYARLSGHRFADGTCKGCGAVQCEPSPTNEHQWMPWEDGKRKCVCCGLEVPDRTASLFRAPKVRERIAWHRLPVDGEVWASNLGKHGCLFMVRAGAEEWCPLWVTKENKLLPLSPRPVHKLHTQALLEDVARRANKVNGAYGGAENPGKAKKLVFDALRIAKSHRIWRRDDSL